MTANTFFAMDEKTKNAVKRLESNDVARQIKVPRTT